MKQYVVTYRNELNMLELQAFNKESVARLHAHCMELEGKNHVELHVQECWEVVE